MTQQMIDKIWQKFLDGVKDYQVNLPPTKPPSK